MGLTKKNHYELDLLEQYKNRFNRYIKMDLGLDLHEVKRYNELLAKKIGTKNILKIYNYPCSLVKQSLDGKNNIL